MRAFIILFFLITAGCSRLGALADPTSEGKIASLPVCFPGWQRKEGLVKG